MSALKPGPCLKPGCLTPSAEGRLYCWAHVARAALLAAKRAPQPEDMRLWEDSQRKCLARADRITLRGAR